MPDGPGDQRITLLPEQDWFIRVALPQLREPHHWNCSRLLRVKQHVDAARLEAILEEVLGRHPALRTRFSLAGPRANGYVVPLMPVVEKARLGGLGDSDVKVRAVATEIDGSLDLSGALAKSAIIESSQGTYLLVGCHHLVCDRWSMDIIVRELEYLIEGRRLQVGSSTIFDWADSLREFAEGLSPDGPRTCPALDRQATGMRTSPPDVHTTCLDETETCLLDDVLRRHKIRRSELFEALLSFVPQVLGLEAVATRVVHNGRTGFSEVPIDLTRTVGRLAIRAALPPPPLPRTPGSRAGWVDMVEWARSVRRASLVGALREWVEGARTADLDISLNFMGGAGSPSRARVLEPVRPYEGHISAVNNIIHDLEIVAGSWSPLRVKVVADPDRVGRGAAVAVAAWLSSSLRTFAGIRRWTGTR